MCDHNGSKGFQLIAKALRRYFGHLSTYLLYLCFTIHHIAFCTYLPSICYLNSHPISRINFTLITLKLIPIYISTDLMYISKIAKQLTSVVYDLTLQSTNCIHFCRPEISIKNELSCPKTINNALLYWVVLILGPIGLKRAAYLLT